MPSFTVDDGGDIDMTGNHLVFEFIKAPRIAAWDQSALVKWRRERQQYERKIKERCSITGESYENVVMGVVSSLDTCILCDMARYSFEKEVTDLTDKDILDAVEKKCSTLLNAHAPEVEEMFKRQINIDLKERDIEARIMKYFTDFDLIVEENELAVVVGRDPLPDTANDAMRMKSRCNLLIDNLVPPVLKAKANDVELRKLIVKTATEQQHFHLMHQEVQAEPKKVRAEKRETLTVRKYVKQLSKPNRRNSIKPPRSGCQVCKDPQWMSDCPSASEEDKVSARQRVASSRGDGMNRAKAAKSLINNTGSVVIINGLIETTYCADTGATFNILPSRVLADLLEVDETLSLVDLKDPVEMEVADGRVVCCYKEVSVDLKISTSAGPVNIRNVNCLVLECEDEEFLLGNNTLKSMGIDVSSMIEQMTGMSVNADAGEDIPVEECIGQDAEEELQTFLGRMIREAESSGFQPILMPQLRDLVLQYRDVWRVRIGPDAAAKVAPLKVTLQEGSIPSRCNVRNHPELQSALLKTYV